MNQKGNSQKDHEEKLLSASMEKLNQLQNAMLSTINTFVDKGQITLTINNMQLPQSLDISERLLLASDKKIIKDRLTRLINEAILSSSINGANAAKNAFTTKETDDILSIEKYQVNEDIEAMRKNIERTYSNISSMTKTVVSKTGNVCVVVSGTKVVETLSITDDYLSPKNKKRVEEELIETINQAIMDIQKEIQILIKDDKEKGIINDPSS